MAPSDSRFDRLPIGASLSHYRIDEMLGAGGMGVVYRATDLRLNRRVAIKVIGGAADDELRRRFLKEARSASSFTHPNIVTIHEVDTANGVDFIVMELLDGRSLDKILTGGPMPIDQVLSHAEQVVAALAAADSTHIVHRDIKPANVMLTDSGHVKVLDFGIAKQLAAPAAGDAATETVMDPTVPGAVLGSVSYMSPEQAQGHAVDGRSDVFSFGVLLYEMLAGRRPFSGTTTVETVAKILEASPAPIDSIRDDVPAALSSLIDACLQKDRSARPSAADVHNRLVAIRDQRRESTVGTKALLRRRSVVIPVAAMVVAVGIAGALWWRSGRDVREARRRLPEVLGLADRGDSYAFYPEAARLLKLLPDDPQLRQAWKTLTFAIDEIKSEPPGAEVLVKGYSANDDGWVSLGHTPLSGPRLPQGLARIKFVKDGYQPVDGTPTISMSDKQLDPIGSVPAGMVHVPGGGVVIDGARSLVGEFWLDQYEVSNRQFKAFVDAGGYTKREYWKEPFVDDGRSLLWDQVMARFRDRTGRLGPSTWELGSFPDGQADFPVAGVSWYEAAAFAVYAGKALPTAYQWRQAADFLGPSGVFGDILVHSTFNEKGPTRVGSRDNIGPYGQFDMAGNVKEWCWNEARGGRMILGGGWNEPKYMYQDRDAQPALSRADTYGIRLVKNIAQQPKEAYAFVPAASRNYAVEKPIDDAGFTLIKGLYTYDPRPLNDRVEHTETVTDWQHEVVTFDAAYGKDRVIAHVYLPKSAPPPYQTIIYFPGGDAPLLRSSNDLVLANVDFLIRSGRAVIYPVYLGTYERSSPQAGPNAFRDLTIARVKDFSRVIEYMRSRPELDADRLGYYGVSLGAFTGIIINALEPSIKANVFLGGGLARNKYPPEIDPLNFATRIHAPTLMVNGASDFQFPLEGTQLPLFRLLAMPDDRKRHALFDGGHMPNQIHDVMREMLDWFDRFLGPVSIWRQ